MGFFGSDNDSGSSLSSGGLSGAGGNNDCSSSSLGSNLGGFGGSSDSSDSGGISSHLDGSAGSSLNPSGGSAGSSSDGPSSSNGGYNSNVSDSNSGMGGNSSHLDGSAGSSLNPNGGSSSQMGDNPATSETSSPTNGTNASQTSDSNASITGSQLNSGFSFNGFNTSTNTNDSNGFHLNGSAGSNLAPSLGITGGSPMISDNGVHLSDSSVAQSLSGIVAANNCNDISNYFDNTSLNTKTEETGTSLIGRAWNAITETGNKNIVQSLQAVYNNYGFQPFKTEENYIKPDKVVDSKIDSLQSNVIGASVASISDDMVGRTKAVLDNNAMSSVVSGYVDTMTGNRLSQIAAQKSLEMRDKLGNAVFRSNVVTTSGKLSQWVSKNSPIGTAGTTFYGLYKDFDSYTGANLLSAGVVTTFGMVTSVGAGKALSDNMTTRSAGVAGGVIGAGIISPFTDIVKDTLCDKKPIKEGKSDLPPSV